MNGFFMTFEGGEGAGKSTQIGLLAERLKKCTSQKVRVLREPGGTPIGEEIRSMLKHRSDFCNMCHETELLLMNASRAQLVHEVIRPALSGGEIVLCDRFFDSTTAYQGYGRKMGAKVQMAIDLATSGLTPHLTVVLHVPAIIGHERRARQNTKHGDAVPFDRLDSETLDFFDRVEVGFAALAKIYDDRIVTLDGGLNVEHVAELVFNAFVNKFTQLNPSWAPTGPMAGFSQHEKTN